MLILGDQEKIGISSDPKKMADLQESVMSLDMQKITPEAVEDFFGDCESFEETRIKEGMLLLIKLREDYSNLELFEKIYGFKPIGPFKIEVTPVSFCVSFYNPLDWARIKKSSIISHLLVAGGNSSGCFIKIADGDVIVRVDSICCYRPSNVIRTSAKTKIHEMRHSLNEILGLTHACNFEGKLYHKKKRQLFEEGSYGMEDSEEEESKEEAILRVVDYVVRFKLIDLKNELSAYILDDSSQLKLKLWTFRSRYLLGLYNFYNMPPDFWKFSMEKNDLTEADIERIKERVVSEIDIGDIVKRSYKAVKVMQEKGYSCSWAISYFCTKEHFLEDWLEVAQACPSK